MTTAELFNVLIHTGVRMNVALLTVALCTSTALLAAGDSSKKKEDSKIAHGLELSPVPIKVNDANT